MAAKIISLIAVVACVALMAEAKPQLFAPAVVAAPVAALSAHPLPGTPYISGYSHQAIRHISRSALVAAPVLHSAPYVAAPYASAPYIAASPYYL